LAMLGSNGADKTTTLSIIITFLKDNTRTIILIILKLIV